MNQRIVATDDRGETLAGLFLSEGEGPRPTVIIFPTVMGISPLEIGFGERLLGLGYNAFIADLYGGGQMERSRDEAMALMKAHLGDRPALQTRLLAVFETVRGLPDVEAERIAAIGYCFGGLCALDLARSGAEIRGVASFHGLFTLPEGVGERKIGAKVIAFHGWEDPMVPPEQVVALAAELTRASADWQIHGYGHVVHAFTNPDAATPGRAMYDETAARRSWAALEPFLAEALA